MVTAAILPASETELLSLLRAGDEDAYETLFRTHAGAILAVARRFFGDTDDAAEAVQDAFVSAFRGMGSFAGTARLATWLHRITVNACLLKIRGRNRSRFVPLDDCPSPATDNGRGGIDPLEREESVAHVRECIARLPMAYRTVIELRDIEGLDTFQTAARLGTNEPVVKTRLHRARHALRSLLVTEAGAAQIAP